MKYKYTTKKVVLLSISLTEILIKYLNAIEIDTVKSSPDVLHVNMFRLHFDSC